MSAGKPHRTERGITLWPFVAGLVVLVFATVLNLSLASMTPDEIQRLPWFIVAPYERGGAAGVTNVFVIIGLGIVCLGLVLQVLKYGGWGDTRPAAEAAYKLKMPSDSAMRLETAKYLEGWAATRANTDNTPAPVHSLADHIPADQVLADHDLAEEVDEYVA